jgi:predicted RNA-binding protein Jag
MNGRRVSLASTIEKGSTSDLVPERRLIIDIVEDLNKVQSDSTGTDVDARQVIN